MWNYVWPTWVQVDEVPPESWDVPDVPAFIIEFDSIDGNILLTVQPEQSIWHDRNTRPNDMEVLTTNTRSMVENILANEEIFK